MSFDSDSSIYIAQYCNNIKNIQVDYNLEALQYHSKIFGYSLFTISNKKDSSFYSIGITQSDWSSFIKVPISDYKLCNIQDENEAFFYACITPDVIDSIYNTKSQKIEAYVLQRTLWSDKKFSVTKKIEYEVGYQLMVNLSDILVFQHQKNILNYHADFILELKNNINNSIPSIIVEIDENCHQDRDENVEVFRQDVMEHFNNRFIRVKVPLKTKKEVIKQIIEDTAKRIRDLSKELVIEYTVDISEEDFIKSLENYNIDKAFIKMFLNNKSIDKVFRYTHQEVGAFLEYSDNKNYEEFVKSIKGTNKRPSVFIEGIDYKLLNNKSCFGSGPEAATVNLGGAGLNKKTYLLTRSTFNRLCINAYRKPRAHQCAHYFAKVYEIAMEYIQRLRTKNISNKTNIESKHVQVQKRVNQLAEQKIAKTNVYKMKNDMDNLKDLVKTLTKENETIKIENDKNKLSLKNLIEKLDVYNNKELIKNNKMRDYKNKCIKYQEKLEKSNETNIILKIELKKLKDNEIRYIHKIQTLRDELKEMKPEEVNLLEKSELSNNRLVENDQKKDERIAKNRFNVMSITQLKDICRTNNVSGYSNKNKNDLIMWMIKQDKIMKKV